MIVDSCWQIANLIQHASSLLDKEKFLAWLSLCTDDFVYRIETFSNELKRDMIWLEHDKDEMMNLVEGINEHQRYQGKFLRQPVLQNVSESEESGVVFANSTVVIVHTDEEGISGLYAVGRYFDELSTINGKYQFKSRVVELDSRVLPFGTHVPL